jgi:hypothetical protein
MSWPLWVALYEILVGLVFFVAAWVVGSAVRDGERQAKHSTQPKD